MPSELFPVYRFVPSLSSGTWTFPDPAITTCHALLETSARDHGTRSVPDKLSQTIVHRVPRFTSYVASDILGDFLNYMTGGYSLEAHDNPYSEGWCALGIRKIDAFPAVDDDIEPGALEMTLEVRNVGGRIKSTHGSLLALPVYIYGHIGLHIHISKTTPLSLTSLPKTRAFQMAASKISGKMLRLWEDLKDISIFGQDILKDTQ
ncbi:hypothetical protein C8R45DRAFT_923940 [Mycena sanguinolenta]|nr:hypothetical protein C8R45DRAFT_923940 [Mycena sanguinolenta]